MLSLTYKGKVYWDARDGRILNEELSKKEDRVYNILGELEKRLDNDNLSDRDFRIYSKRHLKLNRYLNEIGRDSRLISNFVRDKELLYIEANSGSNDYDRDYQGRYYDG